MKLILHPLHTRSKPSIQVQAWHCSILPAVDQSRKDTNSSGLDYYIEPQSRRHARDLWLYLCRLLRRHFVDGLAPWNMRNPECHEAMSVKLNGSLRYCKITRSFSEVSSSPNAAIYLSMDFPMLNRPKNDHGKHSNTLVAMNSIPKVYIEVIGGRRQ